MCMSVHAYRLILGSITHGPGPFWMPGTLTSQRCCCFGSCWVGTEKRPADQSTGNEAEVVLFWFGVLSVGSSFQQWLSVCVSKRASRRRSQPVLLEGSRRRRTRLSKVSRPGRLLFDSLSLSCMGSIKVADCGVLSMSRQDLSCVLSPCALRQLDI